jgi:hypothetical protein
MLCRVADFRHRSSGTEEAAFRIGSKPPDAKTRMGEGSTPASQLRLPSSVLNSHRGFTIFLLSMDASQPRAAVSFVIAQAALPMSEVMDCCIVGIASPQFAL